jgi:hypothetical protein
VAVHEPISPELALVDPELAARARASLPEPRWAPRPRPPAPVIELEPAAPAEARTRSYPFWARLTAALWLVVLGILVGGAAIPHAQDNPRVVPPAEDATEICVSPERPTLVPGGPPARP